MQRRDLKALAASDVLAANHVIATHHVGLRLGEAGAVALIGMARQRCLLAPDQPCDGIFVGFSAVGAGESVRALLRPLIKKVAFLHAVPSLSAGKEHLPVVAIEQYSDGHCVRKSLMLRIRESIPY